jgi:hypothetical protein
MVDGKGTLGNPVYLVGYVIRSRCVGSQRWSGISWSMVETSQCSRFSHTFYSPLSLTGWVKEMGYLC